MRLTTLSKGSGCGCKIAPAVLEQILKPLPESYSSLIGGYETNDDAAVWKLDGENLLLSTTDFFTPIVDDPFDFGRVAAANALSDIYAMGGTPLFALAILGFPIEKLPIEVAAQMMAGGRAVCSAAGIPIAGGHSIDIPEPVFGLVVNGIVHRDHLKKNSTAKEGDLLYLTKPLGTGIISASLKREKLDMSFLPAVIDSMTKLNVVGTALAKIYGVHAMTDITGFGLLGHLMEMCEGSKLSAELFNKEIPLFEGVDRYVSEFIFPDNTYRNWNAYEKKVEGIQGPEFITLCDPQTSGGLLIAVSQDNRMEIEELLSSTVGALHAKPIGTLVAKKEKSVSVNCTDNFIR